MQVCRSLFGSDERNAEPLSHGGGDPTDFSPTGLHEYQLVRETFPSKIPGFCKYRSALCLLILISPSTFNLCLLWSLQLFTAPSCPKTFHLPHLSPLSSVLLAILSLFCPNYLCQTSSAAYHAALPAWHLFDEPRSNSSCKLPVLPVVSLLSLTSALSCAVAPVSPFNFRGHWATEEVPQFYSLKIWPLCTFGAWSERVLP